MNRYYPIVCAAKLIHDAIIQPVCQIVVAWSLLFKVGARAVCGIIKSNETVIISDAQSKKLRPTGRLKIRRGYSEARCGISAVIVSWRRVAVQPSAYDGNCGAIIAGDIVAPVNPIRAIFGISAGNCEIIFSPFIIPIVFGCVCIKAGRHGGGLAGPDENPNGIIVGRVPNIPI